MVIDAMMMMMMMMMMDQGRTLTADI